MSTLRCVCTVYNKTLAKFNCSASWRALNATQLILSLSLLLSPSLSISFPPSEILTYAKQKCDRRPSENIALMEWFFGWIHYIHKSAFNRTIKNTRSNPGKLIMVHSCIEAAKIHSHLSISFSFSKMACCKPISFFLSVSFFFNGFSQYISKLLLFQ